MHLPLRFHWLAILLAAGTLARGEVTLLAERTELRSLEEGRVRVACDPGAERAWRWRLAEPMATAPWLTPLANGEARITAPWTRAGGTLTVVAEAEDNPSIRAELILRVVPNPRLAEAGGSWGDAFGPGASPALRPHGATPGPSPAFRIAFCHGVFDASDGPDLARLDRCWLAAGEGGLRAFTLAGEPLPLPAALRPEPGWACHAVAVLPPGPSPRAAGATRLAFCESRAVPGAAGDRDTRIVALAGDGGRREWPLEGREGPLAGRRVRDLALDRDGTLFVAFGDHPSILRIDPAGRAAPHAHLPATGADGPDCMALDPDTGRLYLGGRSGLLAVDRSGAVTPALGRGPRAPSHLALRGRELLITDGRDGDLWAWHLDRDRLAAVVAGQAGHADTRPGPVQGFRPDLPEADCAALGGPAPVAFTPEGLGLLAGAGFAFLDLPASPLTATPLAKAEAPVDAPPEPAPGPAPRRRPRGAPRPRLGGLFCSLLLALGALSDPAVYGALAIAPPVPPDPPFPDPGYDFMISQGIASLGNLDAACAEAFESGAPLAPCGPDYQPQVLVQADAIRQEAQSLFVDPAVLGAGGCVPGESPQRAKERLALYQGDIRADYDALSGDCTMLQYQLVGAGYRLLGVSAQLLADRALEQIPDPASKGLAALPAYALDQASVALLIPGYDLQAGGDAFGAVGGEALQYQARFQLWVDAQEAGLMACARAGNATGGAALAAPAPVAPLGAIPPSVPTFAAAMARMGDACALAGTWNLNLWACAPATLASIRSSNATIVNFQASLACLTESALEGRQEACPTTPLSSSGLRADVLALFDGLSGAFSAAANKLGAAGNAVLGAANPLDLAANTAALLGNATASLLATAAYQQVRTAGFGLLADGNDLSSLSGLARRWKADITHRFNAESRARWTSAASGAGAAPSSTGTVRLPPATSSTGATGVASSTGLAIRAPQAGDPPDASSTGATGVASGGGAALEPSSTGVAIRAPQAGDPPDASRTGSSGGTSCAGAGLVPPSAGTADSFSTAGAAVPVTTGWEVADEAGRDTGVGLWPLGNVESSGSPPDGVTSGASRRWPFWSLSPKTSCTGDIFRGTGLERLYK